MKVTYSIASLKCDHCARTVEREVGGLRGVLAVKAEGKTKKLEISFEPPATEEAIKALLAEIDYPVSG